MPDARTTAAILLVAGPLVGLLGFYDRALFAIWGAPRTTFLATIAAHRRGWIGLNAGFVAATIATAVGLGLLAASIAVSPPIHALVALSIASYALGGALWCAVVVIRTRTAPLLAALEAAGRSTEPAESILGAATGAMFGAFAVLVGLALAGLGVGLGVGGVVSPVSALVALGGVLVVVWYLRAGDIIPAVVYLPTLVLGLALLLGGGA